MTLSILKWQQAAVLIMVNNFEVTSNSDLLITHLLSRTSPGVVFSVTPHIRTSLALLSFHKRNLQVRVQTPLPGGGGFASSGMNFAEVAEKCQLLLVEKKMKQYGFEENSQRTEGCHHIRPWLA
jgi:hypothetical protein